MASFGWKRKIGEKVSKVTSQQFEAEAADEKDVVDKDEGNWLHAIKRRKEILEGCAEKSKQLKDEGASCVICTLFVSGFFFPPIIMLLKPIHVEINPCYCVYQY
uniref:Tetratricopeptide repeat domain 33 n=1 Tax=Cebus imitator TaxID=2715852 RepID=A0A2K5RG96_CEBIM